MGITSSILFEIGSKAGVGGFTELKSAIDLIGAAYSKIKETTKELDQFATMWEKTNQAAVMAADAAAGGLIDTTEVLRGYNKLAASGAKISEEQFKTLTARAADLAQTTGTDATDAFKRLTDGISKGAADALKEYGLKIKEGSTLTETQTKAIEAMTKGYEGFTAKAKTASERFYVLENNLGTISGLMYKAMGSSEAFGDELDILNKALGEFSERLAKSPDSMARFMTSMDGMKQAALEVGRSILNTLAGPFLWIERKLLELQGVKGKGTLEQAMENMMKTTEAEQDRLDKQWLAEKTEEEARKAAGVGTGAGITPTGRGGGGGGRGGQKQESFSGATALFGEGFGGAAAEYAKNRPMSAAERSLGPAGGIQTPMEVIQKEMEIQENENLKESNKKLHEQRLKEYEERAEAREKELEQSRQLRDAWMATYDDITAGAQKQNKWIGTLSKGMHSAINAATTQEKNAGAAIVGVLGEVGSAISDEAGWQALMEVAKAIAAAASQNWAAAAAHGAAAVAFGVAAAAAGKGGGGGGEKFRAKSGGMGERFAGGIGPSYGGEKTSGGQDSLTINIQMKEGAGGLFDALVQENDRASIDGRRNFMGN